MGPDAVDVSISWRLDALFPQCVQDHCWEGDQRFCRFGDSSRAKQGEYRPEIRLIEVGPEGH